MADSRLCAEVTAWISPVKCRLISSAGTICALPLPVAPPFIPRQGPREGSRRAATVFTPALFIAWASPIVVSVLPSPAGVGLTAVTSTSFPLGRSFNSCQSDGASFALYLP
ncbi:hypothetical protein D3C71_1610980 [compost metagenome]